MASNTSRRAHKSYADPQQSQPPRQQKTPARRSGEVTAIVFWTLAIAVLGAVLLLNLQPWFALGQDFVSQIDTGLLVQAANWLIGGKLAKVIGLVFIFTAVRCRKKNSFLAAWLGICGGVLLISAGTMIAALGELMGFVFWSWIQIIQVSPMLVKHSIMGGDKKWMRELRGYRVAAYLVEATACLIKYPPYAGGNMSRLIGDLSAGFYLDPGLWSWSNFFWAIATMAAVELTLHFLLKAAVAVGTAQVKGA